MEKQTKWLNSHWNLSPLTHLTFQPFCFQGGLSKSRQPIQCQQFWTCKTIHRQTLSSSTTWSSHVISIPWSRGKITCNYMRSHHAATQRTITKLNVFKCSSDAAMNWIKQTTQKTCWFLSADTDLKAMLHSFIQDETQTCPSALREWKGREGGHSSPCVSFAYCCLLTCVMRGIEFHCCSDMLKDN